MQQKRVPSGSPEGGQYARGERPVDADVGNLKLHEGKTDTLKKPKVVVKIAKGGQVTLKQRNGQWENPSVASSKMMRDIGQFDLSSPVGCKEVCLQVVVDLLNEGKIEPQQEQVTETCKEIMAAGYRISGLYWPGKKSGQAASNLYHYKNRSHGGVMTKLALESWTSARVEAAIRTIHILHDWAGSNDDSWRTDSVEYQVATLAMKAGSILITNQALWRHLFHVVEGHAEPSTLDRDDVYVKILNNHLGDDVYDSFLRIAHKHEANRLERYNSKPGPFSHASLIHLAGYVASHPHTPEDVREEIGQFFREMGDAKFKEHVCKDMFDELTTLPYRVSNRAVIVNGLLKVLDGDHKQHIMEALATTVQSCDKRMQKFAKSDTLWRDAKGVRDRVSRLLKNANMSMEDLPDVS